MPDIWWQAYYQPQSSLLPLWRRRRRKKKKNKTQTWRRACVSVVSGQLSSILVYASLRSHPGWPAPPVNHPLPFLLIIHSGADRWSDTLQRKCRMAPDDITKQAFFCADTKSQPVDSASVFVSSQQVRNESSCRAQTHQEAGCGWISRSCDAVLKSHGWSFRG